MSRNSSLTPLFKLLMRWLSQETNADFHWHNGNVGVERGCTTVLWELNREAYALAKMDVMWDYEISKWFRFSVMSIIFMDLCFKLVWSYAILFCPLSIKFFSIFQKKKKKNFAMLMDLYPSFFFEWWFVSIFVVQSEYILK